MLIVAENELIKIETQFAEKLTIPINKYILIDDTRLGFEMSESKLNNRKESQLSHHKNNQTKSIKINDLQEKPL